ILVVGTTIPLLSPLDLPLYLSPHTYGVWDTTMELDEGNVAIVSIDFGPATMPENYPQATDYIWHCKKLGIKVIGVAFWATGAPIGERAFREVYGDAFPDIPEYGETVVYVGAIPGGAVGMRTFGDNTWVAISADHYGTDFAELSLMDDVRRAEDFDIWMEVTSGTPGPVQVVMFVQTPHPGLTVVAAGTAVTIPEIMPYYATGQISGLLYGLAGAGEYQRLLYDTYEYPYTLGPGLDAQSIAHTLVIIFVIVGNIGFAYIKLGGRETR
ncbi:MAG: hypothetical protein JSW13_01895, partial [Candidatus Aerophobus sp.]